MDENERQKQRLKKKSRPLGTKLIVSSLASVALGSLAWKFGKSPVGGVVTGVAAFAAGLFLKY